MPPLARTISGTRYVADDNPLGLRTLSLQFSDDRTARTRHLSFSAASGTFRWAFVADR